ncbi:MAG: HAMP domain-containing histidine kinase [Pseudobdellovibrionaceae bacterium]|nr:MAG: HAMP domain-containing histidine kinase [Pseudobdellovibrionaceae bacterium]
MVRCNFSKKIFLSIFVTTVVITTGIVGVLYYYSLHWTKTRFVSRYSVLTNVLGDTLKQLERTTDILMMNAAKVVKIVDSDNGILSTEALKSLTYDLNITHLFIIDRQGQFIRSTNEDPALIPNLFSFCDGYRGLLAGTDSFQRVPIIPPIPEPNPYKFLIIPNQDRSRLIEVAVKADFIGETMTRALSKDSNVLELGLYSPNGTNLGFFGKEGREYQKSIESPANFRFDSPIEDNNHFLFFTRVDSSQPYCCQCKKSGLTRDGEYYYILRAKIDKSEMNASMKNLNVIFGSLLGLSFLLSLIFSRQLSMKLVENINVINSKVKEILDSGNLGLRLEMKGNDEVSDLAENFDKMTESLERSQIKLLDSQKAQLLYELAKKVAHDIRSPLMALEIGLKDIDAIPEERRNLIKSANKRIHEIATDLLRQHKKPNKEAVKGAAPYAPHIVSCLLMDIFREKQMEIGTNNSSLISLNISNDAYFLVATVGESEFKSLMSNLINNALESVKKKGHDEGRVWVELKPSSSSQLEVCVFDNGLGFSEEILDLLGKREISWGKGGDPTESGSGLGVYNACRIVNSHGGSISFSNNVNSGAKVSIKLPCAKKPTWMGTSIDLKGFSSLVVFDDDPSVHDAWNSRLKDLVGPNEEWTLLNFNRLDDFRRFLAQGFPKNALFLVDYHIANTEVTGLDVIEAFGISDLSFLVTNAFQDHEVIASCNRRNIKIIPKPLVPFVPIQH